MIRNTKKMTVGVLAAAGIAVALSACSTGTTGASHAGAADDAASGIHEVDCGTSGALKVEMHGNFQGDKCYQGTGTTTLPGGNDWVTLISTGNNKVQFLADGHVQPGDGPIAPNTTYTFPHTSGGAAKLEQVIITN
jgi:hypothetical protein